MIYFVTNQTSLVPYEGVENISFERSLEILSEMVYIGVDTETTGFFDFSNTMLTLQMGNKDTQVIYDWRTPSKHWAKILSDQVTNNPKKLKIFANGKFDYKFLWFSGFELCKVVDVMLMEQLLHCGKNVPKGFYGLDAIAKRHLKIEISKSERTNISSTFTSRFLHYAAKDVEHLESIMFAQQPYLVKLKLLKKEGWTDIYSVAGLENECSIVFADIEYNGVKVDFERWQEVRLLVAQEVKNCSDKITEYIWQEPKFTKYRKIYADLFTPATKTTTINWKSSIQKLEVLRQLVPNLKNTSEREISKYTKKYVLFSLLAKYSKMTKLNDAFAKKMEGYVNPATKRIHPEFKQILRTGRVSCKNPNLQQIPSKGDIAKKMRNAFVVEKGNMMVGGDFSGCELRLIAEMSKDPVWVNSFLQNKDLHSELCALTFGIDVKDVKQPTPFNKDLTYRDVQKTINFGLAYGMTHIKLSDTIKVSEDEAKNIIERFFNAVPIVSKYLESSGKFASTNGYCRTPWPYGRIRFFQGYQNKQDKQIISGIERMGKNTPIQGANADITKLAMVLAYREIKEKNYPVKIILPVHDEIQTECAEHFAEEWKSILSKIMTDAACVVLQTVPMVVDCKVSDHWTK